MKKDKKNRIIIDSFIGQTRLTRSELARRSNVSIQTISNILKFKRGVTNDTFFRIMLTMGYTNEEIKTTVGTIDYAPLQEYSEETNKSRTNITFTKDDYFNNKVKEFYCINKLGSYDLSLNMETSQEGQSWLVFGFKPGDVKELKFDISNVKVEWKKYDNINE